MAPSILLTTPHFIPEKGGLATYAYDLSLALEKMGSDIHIFKWGDSTNNLLKKKFDIIIHIHFLGHYKIPSQLRSLKSVCIIHGSEILFTSPNLIKKYVKYFLKRRFLQQLSQHDFLLFVSNFTYKKTLNKGLLPNFARDIILLSPINTDAHQFKDLSIEKKITFCTIVRDVPHKNIKGCIELAEKIQGLSQKEVELHINSKKYSSKKINIIGYDDLDDSQRQEIYKKSNFNLLLSKDHSDRGFFEGYGLTCSEAALFGTPSIVANTGGLPENIHDEYNGLIVDELFFTKFQKVLISPAHYKSMREKTYQHILSSHILNLHQRLFKCLF